MSRRRIFEITLIIMVIICSQILLNINSIFVSAAEPTKLKIDIGPTSVPADNNTYEIISVQLQDSRSMPARAVEDTTISLSSSLINVGTVDPTITIPKGITQATAKFYTTYTPGITTITASATGVLTAQGRVTTVGPMPSILAVYGFPSILPANGESYDALIVQLQDAVGSPAKAPVGSVQIMLSSTNNTIASVPDSVMIEAGNTYANVSITTTQNAIGSATITAIASGYASKSITIKTQRMATTANTLKLYIAPSKILAEGKLSQPIAVQLMNSSGYISQIANDVNVTLSSSSTNVGTIAPTIIIPAGKTYTIVNFTSTFRSGTTTITAAATDFASDQEQLVTVGPIPTKLAVYCLPPSLPADGQQYRAVQVQLQDAQGKPAKDPEGNVTVNLFSSEPDAGTVIDTLTIPFGQTYATGTFTSTSNANTNTITAQTSGYESGQSRMTTYIIDKFPLSVSVIADPTTIYSSNRTTIEAQVTYSGTSPITGARVTLKSDKGGTFSPVTDQGNGYYTAVFTAPVVSTKTVCNITVNASKTGYDPTSGKVQITVNPSPTRSQSQIPPTQTDQTFPDQTESSQGIFSWLIIIIVVAAVAIVAIVIILFLRKRTPSTKSDVPSFTQ